MTLLFLAGLLLWTGATRPVVAAEAKPHLCTLLVQATGLRNEKGVAGVSLFNSPDGWPENNDKAFAQDSVPITGSRATISFKLPPGKYSVVVLHDENMNNKLDRNFLGIPSEGFGFANNPRVFLTAPSFKAATVNVACPETDVQIRMIYK